MPTGQALVEFALIAPVMIFTILGAVEAGFLIVQKGTQDRATAVVAEWAAEHPSESWQATADRVGLGPCTVAIDATRSGLVTASTTCEYHPVATHGLWDGLPISSTESAAVRSVPAPSSSPDPSPSPT